MSTGSIDPSWADAQREAFVKNRANRVARNAVTSDNVWKAARDVSHMRTYHDTFSVSRPRTGGVTNQRHSGRCWMFSSFNVARAATIDLLDVDDFEFSQTFGMFWDKLEKANMLLENVIERIDRPFDDRELQFVLANGLGDGGYYPGAMNIIKKYGLVPKDAMPETACTKDSSQMNPQLERLARRDAAQLRHMREAGASLDDLRAEKDRMLEGFYRMLAICLGEPPATFDLEVAVGPKAKVPAEKLVEQEGGPAADPADKDAKPRRILRDRGITPREFAERYVPFDPADYVQLVSCPGKTRPFGHAYHLCLMDTFVGGTPLRFLNVEPEVIDAAAVASLRAGVPVEMGCDVMQQFPRRIEDFPGVLALDTMDYQGLFDVDLDMSREDLWDMGETGFTHAMTFQGVELADDGTPVAWRVENSWGKENCKDGYLVISADWFHLYGGEVCVRREFVPAEVLAMWDTLPAEDIMPWSGMGRALVPQD